MSLWKGAGVCSVFLLSACTEGISFPQVERNLPQVALAKPAVGLAASWAYLWSPAARAVLSVRSQRTPKDWMAHPRNEGPTVAIQEAALVGVYHAHGRCLILDAAFGYALAERTDCTLVCERGRWSLADGTLLLHDRSGQRKTISPAASQNMLQMENQVFLPASSPPVKVVEAGTEPEHDTDSLTIDRDVGLIIDGSSL